MTVFSSEFMFIKTQNGTKIYFRMIEAAEEDFPPKTQFSLKRQWIPVLHLPLPCSSSVQNSTALETRSVSAITYRSPLPLTTWSGGQACTYDKNDHVPKIILPLASLAILVSI